MVRCFPSGDLDRAIATLMRYIKMKAFGMRVDNKAKGLYHRKLFVPLNLIMVPLVDEISVLFKRD